MSDLIKVSQLTKNAYEVSTEDFAKWAFKNHIPIVAAKAEELTASMQTLILP